MILGIFNIFIKYESDLEYNIYNFKNGLEIENFLNKVNLDRILNNLKKKIIIGDEEKLTIMLSDLKDEEYNSCYYPFFNTIVVSQSKETEIKYILLHEIGHYISNLIKTTENSLDIDFNVYIYADLEEEEKEEIFADLFSVKTMNIYGFADENPLSTMFNDKTVPREVSMKRDAEFFNFLYK